jgi:hypothetical protein
MIAMYMDMPSIYINIHPLPEKLKVSLHSIAIAPPAPQINVAQRVLKLNFPRSYLTTTPTLNWGVGGVGTTYFSFSGICSIHTSTSTSTCASAQCQY